jgi:hypothetical protein
MKAIQIHYAAVLSVFALLGTSSASHSQSMGECLQSFNVSASKSVLYIFAGPKNVSINSMSCVDAELFREQLFISMNKDVYDSEVNLRSKIAELRQSLAVLKADILNAANKAAVDSLLTVYDVAFSTAGAVGLTATCATVVIGDAPAVVACGAAAGAIVNAGRAWKNAHEGLGTLVEVKANATKAIDAKLSALTTLEQQLDATMAQNIKDNYADLFVSICRAVKEQCL